MSVLTERLSQSPTPVHSARRAAAEALRRFKAFWVQLTHRKQVYALARLDDRMLADIGLTRADLEEASRWSLWGAPIDRLAEVAEERRAARGK